MFTLVICTPPNNPQYAGGPRYGQPPEFEYRFTRSRVLVMLWMFTPYLYNPFFSQRFQSVHPLSLHWYCRNIEALLRPSFHFYLCCLIIRARHSENPTQWFACPEKTRFHSVCDGALLSAGAEKSPICAVRNNTIWRTQSFLSLRQYAT